MTSDHLPKLLFSTSFDEDIARQQKRGLVLNKQDETVLCILARLPVGTQITDPVSATFFLIYKENYVSHIQPWVDAYLHHEQVEANRKLPPEEHLDLSNFDVDKLVLPTRASTRWSMFVALLDYDGVDALFEFDEWALTRYELLT